MEATSSVRKQAIDVTLGLAHVVAKELSSRNAQLYDQSHRSTGRVYKDAVAYVDFASSEMKKRGEICGGCVFFQYDLLGRGSHTCEVIEGEINFKGWCKLWRPSIARPNPYEPSSFGYDATGYFGLEDITKQGRGHRGTFEREGKVLVEHTIERGGKQFSQRIWMNPDKVDPAKHRTLTPEEIEPKRPEREVTPEGEVISDLSDEGLVSAKNYLEGQYAVTKQRVAAAQRAFMLAPLEQREAYKPEMREAHRVMELPRLRLAAVNAEITSRQEAQERMRTGTQVGIEYLGEDRFVSEDQQTEYQTLRDGELSFVSSLGPVRNDTAIRRVTARLGDSTVDAVMKSTTPEGVTREVTAYKVSQLLGFTHVPITTHVTDELGVPNSLQQFVDETDEIYPEDDVKMFPEQFEDAAIFDVVIGSFDRHKNNALFRDDAFWLIDNEHSFPDPEADSPIFRNRRVSSEFVNTLLGARETQLPERWSQRLRSITPQQWSEALSGLSFSAQQETMNRVQHMLREGAVELPEDYGYG